LSCVCNDKNECNKSVCNAKLICDGGYLTIQERDYASHWHFVFALDLYGNDHFPNFDGFAHFYDAFHNMRDFSNSNNAFMSSDAAQLMFSCACCSENLDNIHRCFKDLDSKNLITKDVLDGGLRHAFVCRSLPAVNVLIEFAKQKQIHLDWSSALIELFYKINVDFKSRDSKDINLNDCLKHECHDMIKIINLVSDLNTIVVEYVYSPTFFEQINVKMWSMDCNPVNASTLATMIKQYHLETAGDHERAKWESIVRWYLCHAFKNQTIQLDDTTMSKQSPVVDLIQSHNNKQKMLNYNHVKLSFAC
jgi:hypothetical protein